uniref:ALMS_motif domain-containing protein n=1 Tax=Elaeophora elaphi TaxID=1147741 RepID=A0A0R3S2J6_9BILA
MGRCSTVGGGSQLAILTPNQRENIIWKERERRRLIRYQQVRQLSAQNAAKIRERVKKAKQKEMEELKKRITDAIVQRNHLTPSDVLSPVHVDSNALPVQTPRRARRHQIMNKEMGRAVRRHREALDRLRRENEREQRRRDLILERQRKAREVANARSKRI